MGGWFCSLIASTHSHENRPVAVFVIGIQLSPRSTAEHQHPSFNRKLTGNHIPYPIPLMHDLPKRRRLLKGASS
jgi:hypothetical protein